ncbi:hypothetical protein AV530_019103 [Patagioenas fasciata monilis]|uniref:Uncharacterized protein n=1 Tax=Patagioenas fasciata monilis TaxID=372326 RepID=A0A1V4KXC0_PATFA|nr:hypothetical protein AV530_019103 [Patagioenas fasciata monilis]
MLRSCCSRGKELRKSLRKGKYKRHSGLEKGPLCCGNEHHAWENQRPWCSILHGKGEFLWNGFSVYHPGSLILISRHRLCPRIPPRGWLFILK